MTIKLNNVINLRGLREQAFKFAPKKFQTHCYSKGCELFTPIQWALNGVEVGMELRYQRAFIGETKINEPITFIK